MTSDVFSSKTLGIGEIYVTKNAEMISTVLGSCVSVCLYDAANGVSGMNHHMLPTVPPSVDVQEDQLGRYAETALPELLKRMTRMGMRTETTTAKIFGGARMLSQLSFGMISERNIAVARDILRRHGIRIVAEDVGGERGRKIFFQTDSGKVLVREVVRREFL